MAIARAPRRPDALRVRIGTLSLPGATPAQAARIGSSLRRELATLIEARDVEGFDRSLERGRLDAGAMHFDPAERPEVAGRRLAQVIARALRRTSDDDAAASSIDSAGGRS